MRRLVLLILIVQALFAVKLEIISGQIDVNGSVTTASGDVLVFYEDMLFSSEKMRYDRANKTLDFYGNVFFLKGVLHYVVGEVAHFDLATHTNTITPFFLHDKNEKTWIASRSARSQKGVIHLDAATVSTCRPSDPDWRIAFSSGTYYEEYKWLNLFNMRFFAGDIPIFYLPYIGIPTDTSRHSGILAPAFGQADLDGYLYDQPYYLVLGNNMDLELRYQIRTSRGNGGFAEFRFVDSPTSTGSIRTGIFRDFDAYLAKLGLQNQYHYGVELDYTRTHLLDHWFDNSQDALYSDINLYNDIDFVTLQTKASTSLGTSTIVSSKVNYTWANQDHYFGLYGKYFIDTSKKSNDTTLQELPKGQYHKFIDTFFFNNLIYSADIKSTYRARVSLAKATETLLEVPLIYTLPLFDEYLTFSLTENFSASNIIFSGLKDYTQFIDGFNASASTTYALGTDLTKKYESNVHTLQTSLSLTTSLYENKTGFYANTLGEFDSKNCQVGEACEFAQGSINPIIDTYRVDFTQYLYNDQGVQWFYHRMNQSIIHDVNVSLGSFENEINILWENISLQNDIFYSFTDLKIEKMVSSLSYNNALTTNSVTHFYQNQPNISKYSNYFTFNTLWNIGSRYKLYGSYAYDAILNQSKNWSMGIKFRKRCWGYELSYSERITPILTDTGVSSYTDRYIYAKIELIPLGGFDYTQSLYRSTGL